MTDTVTLPGPQLANLLDKVYVLVDLVLQMDLDVPVMAALLDLRDACKELERTM